MYIIKLIILLSLLCFSFQLFSQEDEEGTKKFCQEIDNKEALKLFEKATDKKKFKKFIKCFAGMFHLYLMLSLA